MIDLYVNDIYNALKNKCYFSALAMSLALPDICGTAEYPDETSTSKRYVEWYDKYLGESMKQVEKEPFLSGEIVYNLRNTFLHTGSPNIDVNKVKEESNRLDKFILVLGDGTKFWSCTSYIDTPIATVRTMTIDVSYLCHTIGNGAFLYYNNNKDKFNFDFYIDTQDNMFDTNREAPTGDPVIKALNQKLRNSDQTIQFNENPEQTTFGDLHEEISRIFSDPSLKEKIERGEAVRIVKDNPDNHKSSVLQIQKNEIPHSENMSSAKEATKTKKKKAKPEKREAQVRSFFGQNFKEKKFKQKKEIIIQAVLKSKTKQQVNNTLMKSFSSDETGIIYKRLSPLIKALPGK